MEGNKDEALRCIKIAEEAISSGNKDRALKFIKIAKRLNSDLSLDSLFAKCERLDSQSSASSSDAGNLPAKEKLGRMEENGLNVERNYTEENVKLIREIKGKNDYYSILGLEKSCSVEEIRKAYRKLSLKVHPDKNKAPGSEDAFKKVSKAFKCLSDDGSRREYDHGGLVDEFDSNYNQHSSFRRRRRRATTANDIFEEEFDPDEIFRAFFGQSDVFGRRNHVYRTRGGGGGMANHHQHQRHEFQGGGGHHLMLLIQLLPLLIILLLAYLPFSDPEYSLHKNQYYQIPKITEDYEVQYFVKSQAFDVNYPIGSSARETIEDNVIKDYKSMLRRYCQMEIQRRTWNRNLPVPHCDKLKNFGVVA